MSFSLQALTDRALLPFCLSEGDASVDVSTRASSVSSTMAMGSDLFGLSESLTAALKEAGWQTGVQLQAAFDDSDDARELV